mmetsp:Transcript_2474/g.5664  ORF Transcript_2474/g.5664 Transcript_2474/m.5664 type:complete len:216 (+) Transcript_2474:1612-2259(+)
MPAAFRDRESASSPLTALALVSSPDVRTTGRWRKRCFTIICSTTLKSSSGSTHMGLLVIISLTGVDSGMRLAPTKRRQMSTSEQIPVRVSVPFSSRRTMSAALWRLAPSLEAVSRTVVSSVTMTGWRCLWWRRRRDTGVADLALEDRPLTRPDRRGVAVEDPAWLSEDFPPPKRPLPGLELRSVSPLRLALGSMFSDTDPSCMLSNLSIVLKSCD